MISTCLSAVAPLRRDRQPRERLRPRLDREGARAGRGCRVGGWRHRDRAFEERGHVSDPLTSTTEGAEGSSSSSRVARSTWSTPKLTTSRTSTCTTKAGPSAPGWCRGGAPSCGPRSVNQSGRPPRRSNGSRESVRSYFTSKLAQNLRATNPRNRADRVHRNRPRFSSISSLRHRHRGSSSS